MPARGTARLKVTVNGSRCPLDTCIATVLFLVASPGWASCEPRPCYVQELRIRECLTVREALPELVRSFSPSPLTTEVLGASDWVIVDVDVLSSRHTRCSETASDLTPASEDPRSTGAAVSLLADASCTEFTTGASVVRFRRVPCCVIGVNRTPECILPWDVIERVPAWLDRGGIVWLHPVL